jgi:hypothetical protein
VSTILEKMKARVAAHTTRVAVQEIHRTLPVNGDAAKAVRDVAIEQVAEGADVEWMKLAIRAVRDVAHAHEYFTTDALWARIPHPREPRALGAVMQEARRNGIAEPTNMTQCSTRTMCHARPLRIWRSQIWNGTNA